MSSGRLAIVGAGGHGRVVADAAMSGSWRNVVFFDDRHPGLTMTGEWPVEGTGPDLLQNFADFDGVMIGIGNNAARIALFRTLSGLGAPLVTVVHPRACVSPRAFLGIGCMVSAGAVINIGAEIGAASIINTGATVDHDCQIAEGVHIAPGANLSGDVTVGSRSWIGVGATVRQGITIGSDVTIGAGAVVVSDMADGVTAVGCPAKPWN